MRSRALLALALLLAAPPALAQDDGPTWRVTVSLVEDVLRVGILGERLPAEPVPLRPIATEPGGLTGASPDADGTLVARGPRVAIAYEVPAPRTAFGIARLSDVLLRPALAEHAGTERVSATAAEGWGVAVAPGEGGAVVFARGLRVAELDVPGARVRQAGLAEPRAEDPTLLAGALPYLGAQGAPIADLLVLRAPADALPEEIATPTFVAIRENASTESLARALARAHQRYQVVEVAPTSGAWLREGEERYHALQALVAAGLRAPEDVDAAIERARQQGETRGTLPRAAEGSALAREKGLVAVRALDEEIRRASGGAATLADLTTRLAEESDRHDSASIQRAAESVAGASLAAFFDEHVYGEAWPETAPVEARADIVLVAMRLDPPRVAPDEPTLVRYQAVNRGTRAGSADLALRVDDALVRRVPVELAVGARLTGSTSVALDAPGDHAVTLGPRAATLTVLSPPQLSLARASVSPAEPRAGQPFLVLVYVENAGQRPGSGRVEVSEAGALLGRTTPSTIDGETTRALTLPMSLETPGLHVLDVRLLSDAGEDALVLELPIAVADEPRETPLPAWLALLAALLVTRAKRAGATRGARGRRRR